VHQQEIDVVDPEGGEAFVHRPGKFVGAQVLMRDLGGEEDFLARHSGRLHGFADDALRAVFPGGVDVAIARVQGCDHGSGGKLPRHPRGAEAERRDCGSIGGLDRHVGTDSGMVHQSLLVRGSVSRETAVSRETGVENGC
jgi:hypothetical protein